MRLFDDDEKIKAFDTLSELYYQKNFGSLSKADIDLLFFKIYIEHLREKELHYDDYTMSKSLGLTEARVRSLKEKYYVKFAKDFSWKQDFADAVKNAKYDENNKSIKLMIEDVNVLKEVRHFVYEHGWYDEFQLNPKLFQCSLDCFIMMCAYLDDENLLIEHDKEIIQILKSKSIEGETINALEDGNYKKDLKEMLYDLSESALCELLETLPFGKFGAKMLKEVSNVIKGKFF